LRAPAAADDLPLEEAVPPQKDAEEERAIVTKLEIGTEVLRGEQRESSEDHRREQLVARFLAETHEQADGGEDGKSADHDLLRNAKEDGIDVPLELRKLRHGPTTRGKRSPRDRGVPYFAGPVTPAGGPSTFSPPASPKEWKRALGV